MNKGFTLVELLAVIIILATLISLTSISVTNVVRDSKVNLSSSQKKLIEQASKNYFADNMDKMPLGGTCSYITLKDLQILGYISLDIVDPENGNKIKEDLKIKVTSENNNLKYEVGASNIDECRNSGTVICELNSGETNKIGSKYECDLGKEKRNFYVLESGSNTKPITLILEGNYDTSITKWNNNLVSNPLFEELTSKWINIYIDQIDLPSVSQIAKADGKEFDNSDFKISLNNNWLYNWPDNLDYNSETNGYWVTSFINNSSECFWITTSDGNVVCGSANDKHGIRPIIKLNLYQLK